MNSLMPAYCFSCFFPFWPNHSDIFHWKCFCTLFRHFCFYIYTKIYNIVLYRLFRIHSQDSDVMSVATILTGSVESWTRLKSNYDKTLLFVLAYCEIKLTDLDNLSELKTGTQHRIGALPVQLTSYVIVYYTTAWIHCIRGRGYAYTIRYKNNLQMMIFTYSYNWKNGRKFKGDMIRDSF